MKTTKSLSEIIDTCFVLLYEIEGEASRAEQKSFCRLYLLAHGYDVETYADAIWSAMQNKDYEAVCWDSAKALRAALQGEISR